MSNLIQFEGFKVSKSIEFSKGKVCLILSSPIYLTVNFKIDSLESSEIFHVVKKENCTVIEFKNQTIDVEGNDVLQVITNVSVIDDEVKMVEKVLFELKKQLDEKISKLENLFGIKRDFFRLI